MKSYVSKIFKSAMFYCTFLSLNVNNQSYAEDSAWRTNGIAQSYVQFYSGASEREGVFSAGGYVSADYLDSANVSFGYNYTFVDFINNAELNEHLFYLSGRHYLFPDALPGKLTLRLDVYFGQDTLSYRFGNAPSRMGRRMTTVSGSSTVEETTDIASYQPQLEFINYSKTFYSDIGYAYSEYDNTPTIKVNQFTPTVGFGWNESYDWLQLRGYFIKVDNAETAFNDDQFNSLEGVYTHWFPDTGGPQMEYLRFSILAGKRVLAVDPDAAVIYSTADQQTGALSARIQWRTSQSVKILALGSFGQYKNDEINDEYSSVLFYINLQKQW